MFDYLLLLGFFFGLVVVLILTFHDLKWGIFLIPAILPTYLLRAQITWIPTTFLELALYLVLLVAVLRLLQFWARKRFQKKTLFQLIRTFWQKGKWIHIFTLLILITAVIGTIISGDKRLSLGILKGWFLDPLIYCYLLIFGLNKLKELRKTLSLMIVPVVILSVYGIIQYFIGDLASDERVRGVFESPNYVSLYFGPILMIFLGLIINYLFLEKKVKGDNKRTFKIIGLILITLPVLAVLFLTKSYAAWLAVLAGSLVMILLIPRLKWLYYSGFLVLAGAGIALQWNNPKLKAVFDFVGGSSMHKRIEIWRASLRIIKDHWFAGIGLGRFQAVYREYIPIVFTKPPLDWTVLHSHNLYLMFWLNLGIIGFLTFLAILVWFFTALIKLARNRKVFAKIKLEYFILFAMMVTILVHGLLDTPYWKNDLAMLFWIVVAGVVFLKNYQFTHR